MSNEQKSNPLDLLRRAIEIAMPDLRHYLRPVRKAKVVASYASSGGKYYADVQPLRNDETVDHNEPVIPKVEIPVMWAGPKRGVVCPPVPGTFCDLSYYDGDPNYPRISNFRWHGMDAPEAELNEFVIQLEPGVHIKIDKERKIISLTDADINSEAGGDINDSAANDWTVNVGKNATITVGGSAMVKAALNASIIAGVSANIAAPTVNLSGSVNSGGADGGMGVATEKSHKRHEGSYKLDGPQTVNGGVTINGPLKVTGGITGRVNGCQGCGG